MRVLVCAHVCICVRERVRERAREARQTLTNTRQYILQSSSFLVYKSLILIRSAFHSVCIYLPADKISQFDRNRAQYYSCILDWATGLSIPCRFT